MNLLLDYVDEIGKICPDCNQNVISAEAVRYCVQFKADHAMCKDCLRPLLQEALRRHIQPKQTGYRHAPKHGNEAPTSDEMKYKALLVAMEVPESTMDSLVNAGYLNVRKLDNHLHERVIPRSDAKRLADRIELGVALEGIGEQANHNLLSQRPAIVERIRSALTP